MNSQIPSVTGELILKELRTAVDLQIELWETTERIREMVSGDWDPVEWVQHTSIFADSGMELGESDLDEFLVWSKAVSATRKSVAKSSN